MDLLDALERAVASTSEIVKETPAELLTPPPRAPSGTSARC